jgi:iron complex transport system permease protein
MKAAKPLTFQKTLRSSVLLVALLLGSVIVGLCVGAFDLSLRDLLGLLQPWGDSSDVDSAAQAVFSEIRLPRVLLALLVGGGLSVAGVIFQVLLRNVLADPYILGVSGGASVGALTAIATGLSSLFLFAQPLMAFAGAAIVVVLVYRFGARSAMGDNTLLLSGVMIGAFLSAIILALVTTMDRPVRNALFWLVGFLGNATITEVYILLPIVVPLSVVALLLASRMNVLALGRDAAQHLGIPVRAVTGMLYVIASLLTAAVVSFSGAIGFIGLIVPHVCRRLFGPDHRLLIPAAFFSGAIFLIMSDIIARSIIAPSEMPVGAVTAALGAPVFLYILRRNS